MVVFVDYVIGVMNCLWRFVLAEVFYGDGFCFCFIGEICKMICVWKCFEIDFVWCGRCVLYVCWARVMQIETVYYDVLLFICYYIYKMILLFWAVWV